MSALADTPIAHLKGAGLEVNTTQLHRPIYALTCICYVTLCVTYIYICIRLLIHLHELIRYYLKLDNIWVQHHLQLQQIGAIIWVKEYKINRSITMTRITTLRYGNSSCRVRYTRNRAVRKWWDE